MIRTKPANLNEILQSFLGRRIIVLGDIMLDEYIWGKVQRISPEAPVPIVEINSQEYRLGGAANVALNLAALGAKVELVGVCGKDSQAKTIIKLMKHHKLNTKGIFFDTQRSTTLKTRIGASNQQIVRIDREVTSEMRIDLREDIEAYLEQLMPDCDALIIEDYDKGLLECKLIQQTLYLATHHKIPVAVDPKLKNFCWYGSVEILKPNYVELQTYLGKQFATDENFLSGAKKVLQELKPHHLVVTRGSKGMFLFSEKAQPINLPSFAREVFDVSGAGDTVISALTLAYLFDHNIRTAALIANHAAAVVIAKLGTATVSIAEIRESFNDPEKTN